MPDLWKRRAPFHLPGLMKRKSVGTLPRCIACRKTAAYQTQCPIPALPGEGLCPVSEISERPLYSRELLPVMSIPGFVLSRWKYQQQFWEGQGLGKDIPIHQNYPPHLG